MVKTNIQWLPEIPDGWRVLRGKFVFSRLNRPVRPGDEVVTCFRDGTVTLRRNRREDGFTLSDKEYGYQGVEPGDLVVHGMDGFAGSIGISDSRGKATPVLNVLDSPHNKRYLMYYFRTLANENVFLAMSTGIRVRTCDTSWKKLSNLPILLPPSDEQKRIADFLDDRIGKIDALIENEKVRDVHLKETDASLIRDVVFNGMTIPSNIAWFPKCPKEWRLTPIKRIFDIFSGATPKSDNPGFWDGTICWITPSDFKNHEKTIDGSERTITEEGYDSCGTHLVPKGSIIFTKRAPIGNVRLAGMRCCTNQGCLSCVPKQGVYSDFFYYIFVMLEEQFNLYGRGTTFREISFDDFANFLVPLPPLDVQRSLGEKLDILFGIKANTVVLLEQKIDRLNNYKKSLIYEYVTGKRRLPS